MIRIVETEDNKTCKGKALTGGDILVLTEEGRLGLSQKRK